MIEFDPTKDQINLAKHGISLRRASDLEVLRIVEDPHPSEPRWRAFGMIDGKYHCLAYTLRGQTLRAISLRRARSKEVSRYVALLKDA